MSRKSLCDKQISEVLDSLADLEVDREELICDEDSQEDNILPNEDDSSSSSYEDSDQYGDQDYITTRDGTQWRKTSPLLNEKL